MADAPNQSIIIKKIKKGGHGHHGGAWKVAYADFVTAMMAFFLLLWLLSSTSESQKEGIADYFTPTTGLKDAMGIGFKGGTAPDETEGVSKESNSTPGVVVGQVQQGQVADAPETTLVDGNEEANLFDKAEAELKQAMESDPNLRDFADNIMMEQTPEGLKISVKDSAGKTMFQPGSSELSEAGRIILSALAPVIKKMPNKVSIIGHTDAVPLDKPGYSNWELSSDRANSARRFLDTKDLGKSRMGKVVGMADQELLTPEQPAAEANRRIEVILLKGEHLKLADWERPATRSLLSVPNGRETLERRRINERKAKEAEGNMPLGGFLKVR